MKTYVYIAGPYMGKDRLHDHRGYYDIEANINRAREAAGRLAQAGIPFFCPHLNSAHFEVITPDVPPDYWYELDMIFLRGASAVLLLEGWESSPGARNESKVALALRTQCFELEDFEELVAWWKAGP